MTIAASDLNRNRQTILVAEQAISVADFDAVDAQTPAVAIPAGATVVGGFFIVDTVSNDGGAHDAEVGDADDDDRYSAVDIDLKTAGATALDVTGFNYTEAGDITFNISQETAPDPTPVFEGRLVVEYVVTGRGGYNQA